MTTDAISQGQAAQAGTPTNGRNIKATTPDPIEISVVVESGSSPTLISAFQPAWQAAANKTARKTKFSMPALRSHLRRGWSPKLWASTLILRWPRHFGAERLGRMPAPMRIVEETARDRNHVGLTLGYN